jgi:hypothetical protein
MHTKPKTKPQIPDDLTLMTTSALGDVERIASVATRADLIGAIRWCDGNPTGNAARREILAEALRRKGDAK